MINNTFPNVADRLSIHASVYIASQTYVHGSVTIGADSSVWPMAVIRGDEGEIRIGTCCNIQDGCILHADPDAYLTIGDNVTIGHGAIVHGCTVGNDVLIGMGAVILNHAQIGEECLIAARALITEGMIVPPRSVVMGIPGKIKPLREDQLARIRRNAQSYVELKEYYLQEVIRQSKT